MDPPRDTGEAPTPPRSRVGPLDLEVEELRRLGYWVVDRTIEHLTTPPDRRVVTISSYDDLAGLLGGPLPRDPRPPEEGLALLADVALAHQQHGDHPRFFARVPGPSSPVAVLGEWLATGMQGIASSWSGGSGTATLELVALDWLREALGLAPGSEGVLVSGGSMGNTTALVAARAERGTGAAYLSNQTHSSINRGLSAMGWASDLIRVLPTDERYRLAASTLRQAVTADLAAGIRPAVVVATAGTTNTGAVDDLPALADVCAEHGLWLHVDGAYGGPAALASDHNGILGLDRADSFVLDPHKWLFQPYDIACVWMARPGALERTFAMHPEYLRDAQGGVVDLHNRGLELTRRCRAAKLWLTLRSYGVDALADAVQHGVRLAEYAQQTIEADPRLSVTTPAQLGIVTFQVNGLDDAGHVAVAAAVTAGGYAALTSTVLSGRAVLRLCTINPRTTHDDIRTTLGLVADSSTADSTEH